MASKVQVLLVDDLDGTELGTDGETISFAFNGRAYEIDLSHDNARQLQDTMGRYIEHARRPANGSPAQRRAMAREGSSGASRNPEAKEARAWLIEHGFLAESHRGRISGENWERYHSRGQMHLEGASTGDTASAESQMTTEEVAETPAPRRARNSRKAQETGTEVETPEEVSV